MPQGRMQTDYRNNNTRSIDLYEFSILRKSKAVAIPFLSRYRGAFLSHEPYGLCGIKDQIEPARWG